jgi:hypothetical protein
MLYCKMILDAPQHRAYSLVVATKEADMDFKHLDPFRTSLSAAADTSLSLHRLGTELTSSWLDATKAAFEAQSKAAQAMGKVLADAWRPASA